MHLQVDESEECLISYCVFVANNIIIVKQRVDKLVAMITFTIVCIISC